MNPTTLQRTAPGIAGRQITRRQMVELAGLAAVGTAFALRSPAKDVVETPAARPFDYRLLLGWINDNCPHPLIGKRWPIIDVDERTVTNYASFFRLAKDYGYNGITLWGLYVSHAWPVPLKKAIEPGRRKIIDRILEEADRNRIKVLFGLGVYSWGFEEIIKHDPTTARNEGRMAWGSFAPDNGVAMCYHSESARQWMRDIVDLCVTDVGTQGFGFQSGDLGRCYCTKCRQLSDVEFHSRVINETAAFIKQRHPKQILGMSAWGVDFGGGAGGLMEMTRHLDFLTDVTDQSARKGRDYRRSLTASLPCALGSLGGAVIVPPQRWERDRWFLPHAQMTAQSIKSLHEDGGRAFEFFDGPLNNPQYDLMTCFVGLLLKKPDLTCEQALSQVVERMFAPKTRQTAGDIAHWLLDLEHAYMSRVGDISSGEFDFEPLKGETAGEPIYLARLSADALAGYEADLSRYFKELPGLAADCGRPGELSLITRCLDNVLRDVQQVRAQRKP